MGAVRAELERRQLRVDEAFAELDEACRELDEMRTQMVELMQLVDGEDVPSLDNRRGPKGKPITWNGKTMSIWQWSQLTGIRANTIYLRIKRGWSVERSLTEKEQWKPQPKRAEEVQPDLQPPPADLATEVELFSPAEPEPALPPAIVEHPTVCALPPPHPCPPPVVKAKVEWKDVVAASTATPEPEEDEEEEDEPEDDDGATMDELEAEVVRQQQGQRGKSVDLATTIRSSGEKKHSHRARVDHFGDGHTLADDTGHAHRIVRFVVTGAHKHIHHLTIPLERRKP